MKWLDNLLGVAHCITPNNHRAIDRALAAHARAQFDWARFHAETAKFFESPSAVNRTGGIFSAATRGFEAGQAAAEKKRQRPTHCCNCGAPLSWGGMATQATCSYCLSEHWP